MMGAFIKYSTAQKCPVHQAIAEMAAEYLTRPPGVFHKERVIDKCNMRAVASSIRWDYVKRMIEDEWGQADMLFPLAQSFWTGPRDKDGNLTVEESFLDKDKVLNPGKYIASGHGKKTAGYGLICDETGHFALYVLKHKNKVAQGTRKAAGKTASAIEKQAPRLASQKRGQKQIEMATS
jgi:hypothetical protein